MRCIMNIYDFTAKDIDGVETPLKNFEGEVLLIVNTASKCGFTPQFKDLETIYEKHKDQKFSVLGFPCNQFNQQDPGSEEGIKNFCELNYGVTFPMFSKIDVNGKSAHPLFVHLRKETKGLLGGVSSGAYRWEASASGPDAEGSS